MSSNNRPASERGPHALLLALRELRWSQMARLARYRLGLRSGWYRRRSPFAEWDVCGLDAWLSPGIPSDPAAYAAWREVRPAPAFFFDVNADLRAGLERAAPDAASPTLETARAILDGRFTHFGQPAIARGFPPDWAAFAPLASGERADLSRHWTEIRENEFPDDIKLVWEISRFGWVFPLVRAYRWTGEARFAEACFALCASWRAANAPNRGPNWLSAQEVAIRLLALTFAYHGLWPELRARPVEAARLLSMIAAHAERIPLTLDYARAQGNNHLLTEAAALLTVGLLFPELRASAHFASLGRRSLEQGLNEQVFVDGGYIQHSTNYHRLALQVGVWSAALAAQHGWPLGDRSLEALRRSVLCLGSLVDPMTGRVPNLGPNDGGLVLPLTSCAFSDFRPVVQAGARLLLDHDAFGPGPWDEESLWLGLLSPVAARKRALLRGESFPQTGMFRLEGKTTRAWMRAISFRSRPGHSDQLHLDIWRHGQPLAQDAGTYLYNAAPPWDNALDRAAVHNTVVVDGQEPMVRAGRFLWLDWSRASVCGRWSDPARRLEALLADHDGYRRLGILQQRTVVRLAESGWLVVDDLLGQGEHEARLGWLLAEGAWTWLADGGSLAGGRIRLRVEPASARVAVYIGGACIHGDALPGGHPAWGWASTTYAQKQPAPFLTATVRGILPLRIMTRWAFEEEELAGLAIDWRASAPGKLPFSRLQLGTSGIEA